MKRDMDLVRNILLVLEKQDDENHEECRLDRNDLNDALGPKWRDHQIAEHVRIMGEAGLIDVSMRVDRKKMFSSIAMKWDGYEFLNNARDENVWQKAKSMFGEASFDALKQGLLEAAKQALLGG